MGKYILIGLAGAAGIYSFLPTIAERLKYKAGKLLEREMKTLYLTFDDGPHSEWTPKLLDLLNQYEIKATFFVVAEFAKQNPELIERMKAEGHVIGLHSLRHQNALTQLPGQTEDDFQQSIKILRSLGVEPKLYRPPWGQVNLATGHSVRKYELKKVLWDVMAEDWRKYTSEEAIQSKLLKRSKAGDIICLHDGRGGEGAVPRMLRALEKTIPIWKEEGYVFKTLA